MAADNSERFVRLNRLAEEFAERYRRGERPSLQDYVDRHPELADDIREFFPAMAEMEQVKEDRERAGEEAAAPPGAALQQLGDFRILREVGKGGMGVVYEAEQVSLGRHVALKVLPRTLLPDARARRRFEREARSAARLHHTNIVPVFGVGEQDGVPYYVMQFIQGLGLDDVLEELKKLQPDSAGTGTGTGPERRAVRQDVSAVQVARSLLTGEFRRGNGASDPETADTARAPSSSDSLARSSSSVLLPGGSRDGSQSRSRRPTYCQSVAALGVQVAGALEYAHQQGVLHRDIKPSNLLLDTHGTAWVTDFGLAKADDQPNLTQTGDVLGTLRYMPPEAFEGKSDARGDVYSLGLTLYEMLAFRPAFEARERNRLIKQVTQDEPARLRKLNRHVPRDLETVVHKAIDKDPGRRYASAAELAADLQRFLDDEPIHARRVSAAERLRRWCRRNPLPAGMAALVLAITLAGIGGILWQWQKAERARREAEAATRARELTLADMETSFGLAAGARGDARQAVLWFADAARLAGADRERAAANRTRAAAWGRLAVRPVGALVHPARWVEGTMAFHPGGRHLLSRGLDPASGEMTCRLWDLDRQADVPFPGSPGAVSAAAWDAPGERLAVGTPQGEVTICRFPGGEPLQRIPCAGRIARVLFSPDGRSCAVAAGNRARVWDCRQAAFVTPELEHPAPVTTLAFHPRGELLATGCQDETCRVFAVPAALATPLFDPVPQVQARIEPYGHTSAPPLFLDGGRVLLTMYHKEACWRDARTGDILHPVYDKLHGFLTSGVSGDGKHVLLAGWSHERIYDALTAEPLSPNLEHRSPQSILSAAFSPDGRTLLTAGADRAARLWSVPGGERRCGPLEHPTTVTAVAFAPDGRRLATAERGGLIHLWALPAGNPRDFKIPAGAQSQVRLSRDGRFLLPSGLSGFHCHLRTTRVFDLETGRPAGPPLAADGFILDAAFSPDGLQVAAAVSRDPDRPPRRDQAGEQPGFLLLWDWRSGQLQHESLQLPSEPRRLDYSPDGRQLAVVCAFGELVRIDPAAGTVLGHWRAHPPHPAIGDYLNNGAVRFAPDGRSLLTFGTETNQACVWDALTERPRHELRHRDRCHDVQFSPDGRLVATAGWDNEVGVWDLETGAKLAGLPHPDWTFTAVFSPDGTQVLTSCRDGMARLWDWRAGRLVCPAFAHDHEVHAVGFTPDGRHVLSASIDQTLRVWEWRTGKPVCPPLPLGGQALNLVVTPDGRRVVCGGFLKDLPVFHLDDWLAPAALGPDDLCAWGEIVSGQRIEQGGGVTNLTAEEWLTRWQEFRRRHPDGDTAEEPGS